MGSLAPGDTVLSADAYDEAGNGDFEVITVRRPAGEVVVPPPQIDAAPPPSVAVSAPEKNKKHKHKHKKGKKGKKKRR